MAVDHLMASLEARTAEAGLYRRQYDALSSRLDHVEKAHRESRAAARQHAEHEVSCLFMLQMSQSQKAWPFLYS